MSNWNDKLRQLFVSSGFIAVDEQLVSSRCRSPHRFYNPKKPGEFGELIRLSADAEYRYFFKGNPYVKAPQDPSEAARQKEVNKSTNVVLDLISPVTVCGYNVTAAKDSSAVINLHRHCCNLIDNLIDYLGTMMQNRREIPSILHQNKPLHTTEFAFGGGYQKPITQLCYQAKLNKKVYMISSQHHDKGISDEPPRKPNKLSYYIFVSKIVQRLVWTPSIKCLRNTQQEQRFYDGPLFIFRTSFRLRA